MRELIKHFVNICAKSLPIIEPIYEFGSHQVPGQEGFADLRPIFPDMEYVGSDMREGVGVDRVLNLHHIDLPDESVGTVLCLDTLEHVEYPRRAMEEIRRILKPDGLVVISSVMNFPIHDYPNDYWRFTPEAFNILLQDFNRHYSDFAGDEQFPHTVIGVAFKGDIPEEILEIFQQEIKVWKELCRGEDEGPENQVSGADKDLPSPPSPSPSSSPSPAQHFEPPSSKRYEPASLINLEDKNDSHSLIVELAGTNNTILEVGTSTGYLTRILKVRGNRVIGIEVDGEAAKIAEEHCDLMITGNVEEIDLDDYLAPGSIDIAVFGDVLEHLRYPAAVLKRVRRYLKPHGSVVVSIPNVCHGDVLINLLNGDFRYTSMGLLDETHLRFFGLKNVLDLLADSGYSIEEVRTTRHPVGGTELRRDPEEVPAEIRCFIEALPNSDVYQFVLLARPSDDPKSPPVPTADLKGIFDRSVEPLLREREEPLRREVAEAMAKSQEASERLETLKEELERSRERGQSLELAVSERDRRIAELSLELAEAGERVQSLELAASEKDRRIAELDENLRTLNYKNLENVLELDSIKGSFTWNAVTKWHNLIFERFFSQGSKRRDYYHICIKSMRIIQREGLTEFCFKAKKHICKNRKILWRSHKGHGVSNYVESPGVDIIIPVYNSFLDVKRCIESVLSYSVSLNFNLFIIDDLSTDPRLIRYLEYMQKNVNNFNLIRNSENSGFVKSVNKGIKLSKNDVVLLNSDTMVSPNWLDEILTCAYLDDKIATVTPLSNNATICSVPDLCRCNDIPHGYTVQQFSNLIFDISKKLNMGYVTIPTGVGFCLFIKRKVIDEIGPFDEIYGKGYNEENDFCMRALQKGYFHVCCTSAFVYHKGRVSFKDEQVDLEATNQKILLARYPEYLSLVEDFVSKNPLKLIQNELKFVVEGELANPEISIGIDCQLLNRDVWTGSERYIFYLIENIVMSNTDYKYILYSKNRIIDDLLEKCKKSTRKYAVDSISVFLDSDDVDVFHRTVQCFNVEDLILLLKSKSSVITILDLILYKYPSYFDTAQEAKSYQLLTELSVKIADKVIAISSHCKYDIVNTLQIPDEKVDVIHLAIDKKFRRIYDEEELIKFKDKYQLSNGYILYIGTDFPHKNIESVITSYKRLTKILSPSPELVIAGPSTSLKRRSNIEKLIDGDKRIKLLDYVDDCDIVYLYNCSGLFVYPSLYEGFGLPILEAMACGVPVVASKATSIPEVAGNAALLVDATDIDELCKSMHRVLINKELQQSLIESGFERVKEFNWKKTAERTVETYKAAYINSKCLEEKLDESTRQLLMTLFNTISESDKMLILDSLDQNSDNSSILKDLLESK